MKFARAHTRGCRVRLASVSSSSECQGKAQNGCYATVVSTESWAFRAVIPESYVKNVTFNITENIMDLEDEDRTLWKFLKNKFGIWQFGLKKMRQKLKEREETAEKVKW